MDGLFGLGYRVACCMDNIGKSKSEISEDDKIIDYEGITLAELLCSSPPIKSYKERRVQKRKWSQAPQPPTLLKRVLTANAKKRVVEQSVEVASTSAAANANAKKRVVEQSVASTSAAAAALAPVENDKVKEDKKVEVAVASTSAAAAAAAVLAPPAPVVNDKIKTDKKMEEEMEESLEPLYYSYDFILEHGIKNLDSYLQAGSPANLKPYHCPVPGCNRSYKNRNGLKYHAQFGHSPPDCFLCPKCSEKYTTRDDLFAHSKTHSKKLKIKNEESPKTKRGVKRVKTEMGGGKKEEQEQNESYEQELDTTADRTVDADDNVEEGLVEVEVIGTNNNVNEQETTAVEGGEVIEVIDTSNTQYQINPCNINTESYIMTFPIEFNFDNNGGATFLSRDAVAELNFSVSVLSPRFYFEI